MQLSSLFPSFHPSRLIFSPFPLPQHLPLCPPPSLFTKLPLPQPFFRVFPPLPLPPRHSLLLLLSFSFPPSSISLSPTHSHVLLFPFTLPFLRHSHSLHHRVFSSFLPSYTLLLLLLLYTRIGTGKHIDDHNNKKIEVDGFEPPTYFHKNIIISYSLAPWWIEAKERDVKQYYYSSEKKHTMLWKGALA